MKNQTAATDPIFQEAHLANALVNLHGSPHTFYEMDLLFKHKNGTFKRFRSDRGSSLQGKRSDIQTVCFFS